jgi:hypothetical protein
LRKDWNDLTQEEKDLYFEAVNLAKTTPHKKANGDHGPGNNIYDLFVRIHEEPKNKEYAHQTSGFLAWHRKYLNEFEDALRNLGEKYACVTVPYWDWASETFQCTLGHVDCTTYHSASDFLRDFGGPGDEHARENTFGSAAPAAGVGCVSTSTTRHGEELKQPFGGWVDHKGRCLTRGVDWNMASQKPFSGRTSIVTMMQNVNYGTASSGFRINIEGTPHGMTHNYLGGHMRSFISPADPIFFSHHCFIDKLWADWQDCHDYDTEEVKNLLLADPDNREHEKYYEDTRTSVYENDRVNDLMEFNLMGKQQPQSSDTCTDTGTTCTKSNADCAACVGANDGWCSSNNWDTTCCNICAQTQCASVCGFQAPIEVKLLEKGDEYLDTWVKEENQPVHVYSVHHMMAGQNNRARSFAYAPDDFNRALHEHSQNSNGVCAMDSHSLAQSRAGVKEEAHRYHHNGKRRGKAAYAFAMMIEQAFNETAKQHATRIARSSKEKLLQKTHDAAIFKDSMQLATAMECEEMAGSCSDYKKKYPHCEEADQARFYLCWLGSGQWHTACSDPEKAKKIFGDPCCEKAKACDPGPVLSHGVQIP